MRSRTLAFAGLTAGALAAATTFAGTAGASTNHVSPLVHGIVPSHAAPAKKGVCYELNQDYDQAAIASNFSDSGFDVYDSAGAADFTVKKKCVSPLPW